MGSRVRPSALTKEINNLDGILLARQSGCVCNMSASGVKRMAVEDGPAWPEWSEAYDQYAAAVVAHRRLVFIKADEEAKLRAWRPE
jgi:hypothetical protein